jgi:acyl carrier protein
MDIDSRMNALFRKVCEIDEGEDIRDEWQPGLRAGWDSLTNLTLIGLLENEFHITLEFDELLSLSNWGEMKKLVAGKTGGCDIYERSH